MSRVGRTELGNEATRRGAVDDSRCQRQAEESNRALWDELARVHIGAYKEVELLRRGEEILDPVELREIGDVRGKTMLHLQCHIGTDSLAWTRRGAVMPGVDFSAEAIACAECLRDELGLEARFLESNAYDLTTALDGEFDVVYNVARCLVLVARPGGGGAHRRPLPQARRGLLPSRLRSDRERAQGRFARRAGLRSPLFAPSGADGVRT
jgi:hypothetical protein